MASDTPLHELEEVARDVGKAIGEACPDGVGFALHLFSFGEGGWSSFVSNVEREDHIRAMAEFIEKAGSE